MATTTVQLLMAGGFVCKTLASVIAYAKMNYLAGQLYYLLIMVYKNAKKNLIVLPLLMGLFKENETNNSS